FLMARFHQLLGLGILLAVIAILPARSGRQGAGGRHSPEQKKSPITDRHGDPLPEFARGRLGTIRFRQAWGAITSVRFLPSGKELMSVGENRIARLWETDTGKERHHFRLPLGNKWVLTPDCRTLVTWICGPSIRVWETSTGNMVHEWNIANH